MIVGRWRRVHGDTALLRRRAAVGVAKHRLGEASREFAAGHATQAAEHILDALLGLIADTLGLTSAGLTSTEACRQLESLGVDAALIGRLRLLLDTCEGVRYGVSVDSAGTLGHEGDSLLRELTAALKRKKIQNQRPSAVVAGCVMLMSLVFSSGCGRSPDSELVRKFQAAQQAFDDAKKPEDFAKAATLDQEILDRFGPSGAVFYNQGNAWMQAGQPGRAVAAYRQAQRYSPRIAFLNDNLAQALGDTAAARQPILETILFWQNWLSYAEKYYLTAAAAIVVFCVGGYHAFRVRPMVAPCDGGRVWRLSFCWRFRLATIGFDSTPRNMVWLFNRKTIARKGNAASYGPAFKEPLREATEFQLVERRGDWLLIRLPGGGEGWIEDKAAVTY